METTNWLKKNKHRLSFSAIERELGIPLTTLSKAVRDQQSLPSKWIEPYKDELYMFLK